MSAQTDAPGVRPTLVVRFFAGLAVISGGVLAAMMLLICAGVAMRYGLNDPIQGSNEILEVAAVTFVMLGLPYCTINNAHIKIDMLDRAIGPLGVLLTELLYRILAVILMWFLAKAAIKRAVEAYEFEDATNMLSIPFWPFYWVMIIGVGLLALIFLVQAIGLLKNRERQND